jgi:hypothetical protein
MMITSSNRKNHRYQMTNLDMEVFYVHMIVNTGTTQVSKGRYFIT